VEGLLEAVSCATVAEAIKRVPNAITSQPRERERERVRGGEREGGRLSAGSQQISMIVVTAISGTSY
jgi:hypothetical protein